MSNQRIEQMFNDLRNAGPKPGAMGGMLGALGGGSLGALGGALTGTVPGAIGGGLLGAGIGGGIGYGLGKPRAQRRQDDLNAMLSDPAFMQMVEQNMSTTTNGDPDMAIVMAMEQYGLLH